MVLQVKLIIRRRFTEIPTNRSAQPCVKNATESENKGKSGLLTDYRSGKKYQNEEKCEVRAAHQSGLGGLSGGLGPITKFLVGGLSPILTHIQQWHKLVLIAFLVSGCTTKLRNIEVDGESCEHIRVIYQTDKTDIKTPGG